MASGLLQLLEAIRQEPGRKILREQYLALVFTLGSEEEKIASINALARLCIDKFPTDAISIAKLALKLQPQHVEALEILAQSLKAIGRHEKANEIDQQLEGIRQQEEQSSIGKAPESLALGNNGIESGWDLRITSIPEQSLHFEIAEDTETRGDRSTNTDQEENAFAINQNYWTKEELTKAPFEAGILETSQPTENHSLPPLPDYVLTTEYPSEPPPLEVVPMHVDFSPPDPWQATKDTTDEEESYPELNASGAFLVAGVGSERMLKAIKALLAKNHIPESGMPYPEDFLLTVAQAMSTTEGPWSGETVAELIQFLWQSNLSTESSKMIKSWPQLFEYPAIWGIFLDGLIANGQARKAIHEVRLCLTHRQTDPWPTIGYERLCRASKVLGLRPIPWSSEQGGARLHEILQRPLEFGFAGLV